VDAVEIVMKPFGCIFLGLVAIGALTYIGFWIAYANALEEESQEWVKENYFIPEISGKLVSVKQWGHESHRLKIELQKDSGEEIFYGSVCVNDAFLNFVRIGDSVHKNYKNDSIQFIKPDGRSLSVVLDFCQ
jgi:hypothetical protein